MSYDNLEREQKTVKEGIDELARMLKARNRVIELMCEGLISMAKRCPEVTEEARELIRRAQAALHIGK